MQNSQCILYKNSLAKETKNIRQFRFVMDRRRWSSQWSFIFVMLISKMARIETIEWKDQWKYVKSIDAKGGNSGEFGITSRCNSDRDRYRGSWSALPHEVQSNCTYFMRTFFYSMPLTQKDSQTCNSIANCARHRTNTFEQICRRATKQTSHRLSSGSFSYQLFFAISTSERRYAAVFSLGSSCLSKRILVLSSVFKPADEYFTLWLLDSAWALGANARTHWGHRLTLILYVSPVFIIVNFKVKRV